ncbi:YkvA family protein [Pontibacter korlensis]|uniref:YkvA family protein n=1 Tax=Pontibacter korlensis TaxID=400092 RepID=UPI000A5416A3|nr:YkvA family protein [Pontibacter korlensis]
MQYLNSLRQKAYSLNTCIYALYLSCRDVKVDWYIMIMLAVAIAYAVSPIDLVPDLTPVFGYLDDVVIVTLGLTLSYRLLPKEVLQQARL